MCYRNGSARCRATSRRTFRRVFSSARSAAVFATSIRGSSPTRGTSPSEGDGPGAGFLRTSVLLLTAMTRDVAGERDPTTASGLSNKSRIAPRAPGGAALPSDRERVEEPPVPVYPAALSALNEHLEPTPHGPDRKHPFYRRSRPAGPTGHSPATASTSSSVSTTPSPAAPWNASSTPSGPPRSPTRPSTRPTSPASGTGSATRQCQLDPPLRRARTPTGGQPHVLRQLLTGITSTRTRYQSAGGGVKTKDPKKGPSDRTPNELVIASLGLLPRWAVSKACLATGNNIICPADIFASQQAKGKYFCNYILSAAQFSPQAGSRLTAPSLCRRHVLGEVRHALYGRVPP